MKIVLLLCCVMLVILPHPIVNSESESFRTINLPPGDNGYSYFGSMAITSSQDLKAFVDELSQQLYWTNRQGFVDALLNAKIDFDREALVLLRYDDGYGATRVPFEAPVLQDKTLVCEIRRKLYGLGPAVMAYHCFALAVSKSLVNKVQLNVEGPEGPRPPVLLSTTERQPLNIVRRDTPPTKPAPADCPKLILGCPTDLLETGKTYLVKLLVEGGNPKDDVSYNWSVTGAQIVGGQGTRSLAIRINQPNKLVETWVSLGGVNPYCNAVASCSCGPSK